MCSVYGYQVVWRDRERAGGAFLGPVGELDGRAGRREAVLMVDD